MKTDPKRPRKPSKPTEKMYSVLTAASRTDPRSRAILARATSDIVSLARQQAAKAFQTLEDALEARDFKGAPDWRARIRAAEVILDRGFGRAPQVSVQVERLPDDALRKAVEAIAAKRGLVVDARLAEGGNEPTQPGNLPGSLPAPASPAVPVPPGGYDRDDPPSPRDQGPPLPDTQHTPESKGEK